AEGQIRKCTLHGDLHRIGHVEGWRVRGRGDRTRPEQSHPDLPLAHVRVEWLPNLDGPNLRRDRWPSAACTHYHEECSDNDGKSCNMSFHNPAFHFALTIKVTLLAAILSR